MHTLGERGFKFFAGDGNLRSWASLCSYLFLLRRYLLQVSVDLIMISGCRWNLSNCYSDTCLSHLWKLLIRKFSESGWQAVKLDKQQELAILILVFLKKKKHLNVKFMITHNLTHILTHPSPHLHFDHHGHFSGVGDYSVVGQTRQRERSLTITFSTIFITFIICFVPWSDHVDSCVKGSSNLTTQVHPFDLGPNTCTLWPTTLTVSIQNASNYFVGNLNSILCWLANNQGKLSVIIVLQTWIASYGDLRPDLAVSLCQPCHILPH